MNLYVHEFNNVVMSAEYVANHSQSDVTGNVGNLQRQWTILGFSLQWVGTSTGQQKKKSTL